MLYEYDDVGSSWSAFKELVAGSRSDQEGVIRRMDDVDMAVDNMTTPLILAVTTGRSEVVRALVAAGADPNRCEPGAPWLTPLYEALKRGDLGIIRELILAGANPNLVDEDGRELDIRPEVSTSTRELVDVLCRDFSRQGRVICGNAPA